MMLDHLPAQLEPSCSPLFLKELELSEEVSLLHPPDNVAIKDIFLGMGGSALAHFLAVLAAVLLPLAPPPLAPREAFVTVNLVEFLESDSDHPDTGSLEGAARGVHSEAPPPAQPEQGEREEVPSPVPPKTIRQAGGVSAPVEKPVKRAPQRPSPKPAPTRVSPVATVEKPSAPAELSSSNAPAEVTLAGDAEGRGHGARGTGEGAGPSTAPGPSAGAGVHGGEFNANGVDQVPRAVRKVEPIYPQRARREGVCGKVVLRFLVEPDGHVSRPSIQEANPSGFFEQSALDAIRNWRFRPGIYQGKAVATWVVLPVQFKLTN